MGPKKPQEPILEDKDLAVFYFAAKGRCALTIFSQDDVHNLREAVGAIMHVSAQISPASRVRYRPAQGESPGHLIVNSPGQLDVETRRILAEVCVRAIKILDTMPPD
jgi:hypothetical protein